MGWQRALKTGAAKESDWWRMLCVTALYIFRHASSSSDGLSGATTASTNAAMRDSKSSISAWPWRRR